MKLKVGDLVDFSQPDLAALYNDLLIDVCKHRYGEDSNVHKKLLEWLNSTDMYVAPASTKYHEATRGGLLKHSLKVYNEAISLMKCYKFSECDIYSVALVALVHDWCKIGLYEHYLRNVKNEDTGQWEQVDAFRTNQQGITLGHGVASMFLASKFFRLTPDEALAIRWHMGVWRVCDQEMNELQQSNETYPLVHLIQFADQLAIVNY